VALCAEDTAPLNQGEIMVALIASELSSDCTNFNYLIQSDTDAEVWHSP
jgi:hypothetical protein